VEVVVRNLPTIVFDVNETLLDLETMTLCTLTDNLLEVQGRQLEHGGIIDLFYRRFSVDIPEVRRHKPAPEAYAYVERQLRVASTLGAVAAGWGAALIKRPGNDVLTVGPQPDLVGTDLDDVANQVI
jgi:2-haloacid dehalogenase